MEMELINALLWAIGGLLGLLVIVIGWNGSRVHTRMDKMTDVLLSIKDEWKEAHADLKERVAMIEVRNERKDQQ